MTNYKMIPAVLLVFVVFSGATPAALTPRIPQYLAVSVDKFWRTELYFGFNKKNGGQVTDDEWRQFLAEVVTPRFPDGFTVLESAGQFRSTSGTIVRERGRVLILLYPKKSRSASRFKIEEIRAAYCKSFDQESVLRMDLEDAVEVTF